MIHWIATDYHWALIILAVTILVVFGWVVVGIDDNGDWWVI